MSIFDTLATSRFSYDTGTAGTVTVPSGVVLRRIRCMSAGSGTLTITPKGPNQVGSAGGAIPIPNAACWFELDMLGELGAGTILVFSSTSAYYVEYSNLTS